LELGYIWVRCCFLWRYYIPSSRSCSASEGSPFVVGQLVSSCSRLLICYLSLIQLINWLAQIRRRWVRDSSSSRVCFDVQGLLRCLSLMMVYKQNTLFSYFYNICSSSHWHTYSIEPLSLFIVFIFSNGCFRWLLVMISSLNFLFAPIFFISSFQRVPFIYCTHSC
jgi:hypothetical protein